MAANGIPRFVSRPYLDLTAIARISRFRSGEGHSYTDAFEACRSMKHYFQPRHDVDAAAIPIVAPIDGDVVRLDEEWAGTQLHIESQRYPAFRVILFHVRLSTPLAVGMHVAAGQPIGTHIGSQTMSDVAVAVTTPAGFQLVSWFDVLDDAGFAQHAARGIASREAMVIARAERDAHPLSCSGEQFADAGLLENWVPLR